MNEYLKKLSKENDKTVREIDKRNRAVEKSIEAILGGSENLLGPSDKAEEEIYGAWKAIESARNKHLHSDKNSSLFC